MPADLLVMPIPFSIGGHFMDRIGGGILIFVLTLSAATDQNKGGDKSDTPAEQYKALLKEY